MQTEIRRHRQSRDNYILLQTAFAPHQKLFMRIRPTTHIDTLCRLPDGTLVYDVLGYTETLEEAQIALFGRTFPIKIYNASLEPRYFEPTREDIVVGAVFKHGKDPYGRSRAIAEIGGDYLGWESTDGEQYGTLHIQQFINFATGPHGGIVASG